MGKSSKGKLRAAVAIPTLAVVAALSLVSACVSWFIQANQTENRLVEQARILNLQMDAVWDFVDLNQHLINTDADGSYNFKGLQCSLAGTSVGKLFSTRSGYIIRYVSKAPRLDANLADELESKAIDLFVSDPRITEYHEFANYDGERTFRYMAPVYVEENCLNCHGGPAGEIDDSGYPKEGMQIGQIIGVISIISPMAASEKDLAENVVREIITVFLLLAVCALVVNVVVRRKVTTPLSKFENAVQAMGRGDIGSQLDAEAIGATGEIESLVRYFNATTEKLQGLYDNLEGEVEARTDALVKANEELTASRLKLEQTNELLRQESQYKSTFVSSMSHELRTPLTSIIAFAEILKANPQCPEAQRNEIVEEIRFNGEILLHFVNDILDVAKLAAGKTVLSFKAVDLIDVVGVVDSMIMPLAAKKGVGYSSEINPNVPFVHADEDYLRIAIKNLVENAIKFTPAGGTVSVRVFCKDDEDSVCVEIKDTGVGISEEESARIFEMFVRGKNSSSLDVSGGKGLGLAIAKEAIELHGGRILLDSEVGQGSTFAVVLPAADDMKETL